MQRYQVTRRKQPATSTSPFTTPRGYLQLFFLFPFHLSFPLSFPPRLLLRSTTENHAPHFSSLFTSHPPPSMVHRSRFLTVSPILPSSFDSHAPLFVLAFRLPISPPLSVFPVCSCPSGSLHNNGSPIQSTIAGHKLPSKTVALDPTGFTLYTNRAYARLIEHPR